MNVGSNDLKIAASALENNAIVVTRNARDFGRVPGLLCQDLMRVNLGTRRKNQAGFQPAWKTGELWGRFPTGLKMQCRLETGPTVFSLSPLLLPALRAFFQMKQHFLIPRSTMNTTPL